MPPNGSVRDETYLFDMRNQVRSIRDLLYGYAHFDPLKRLERRIDARIADGNGLFCKKILYTAWHAVTGRGKYRDKLTRVAEQLACRR